MDDLSKRLWPEPPTDEEADAVVRPVHWLLDQAGTDGLQLTQDGYLKPAVVTQVVRDLGWAYRWPGAANRESQTLPVLMLRQQLQTWKLLRKNKGQLVLSPPDGGSLRQRAVGSPQIPRVWASTQNPDFAVSACAGPGGWLGSLWWRGFWGWWGGVGGGFVLVVVRV
ncbi:hypothetical protein [Pseudarthrobacter sp. 1C304]|uniref:hypothetical protein n=1 Tax=Pseudarthrobacter sp. 1C304 TaxID=3457438 RepID=UPI003FD5448B